MISVPAGHVLVNRYRIQRVIGRGSYGVVYRADDLVNDVQVAVKFIEPASWVDVRRTLREIAALRALRLPGVVGLIDEGTEGTLHYLVMELVDGAGFPGDGGPLSWEQLRPLTIRLLAVVARVHAAGFVHRDIKPQNVLVRPDGWVTLLDFGLARRPHAADTVTLPGNVAGTPEYLAPEILDGGAATPRSDVFSIGVLLYEALTGVPPWTGQSTLQLLRARAFAEPPPLRIQAPDVPPEVELVILRMLARDPRERPGTAAEVMVALDGGASSSHRELPRLGTREPLEQLVALVRAGRSADIGGGPGWGATRLLRDVEAAVSGEGKELRWVRRGGRPFESLVPVVGPMDELKDLGLYEAWEWIRARLRTLLGDGVVVVLDDAGLVDRWSMQALSDVRGHGVVLRAGPVRPNVDITLRPLTEEELLPLFEGPERILHIPSDAAAELWLRTGGIPARVSAELDAWVSAGLASWHDGRIRLVREALFRLEAGLGRDIAVRAPEMASSELSDDLEMLSGYIGLVRPAVAPAVLAAATGWSLWEVDALAERLEAQHLVRRQPDGRIRDASGAAASMRWGPDRRAEASAALAAGMAPGVEGRLVCLLVAGQLEAAAIEAREVAARQANAGRLGDAIATIEQALALARDGLEPAAERLLLEDYTDAALGTESARVLRRADYDLGRTRIKCDDLKGLIQASLAALGGAPDDALAAVEALTPFQRPELELWRQAVRVQAAMRLGRAVEDKIVRGLAEWAADSTIPGAKARYAGWLGGIKFRRALWDEAAMYQAEAVRGQSRPDAKVSALLNGAAALLEAGRYEAAEARAREGHVLALACRHGVYEARAEAILRVLAYRRDHVTTPDLALCNAVATLHAPEIEGGVRLTEAAIAWRGGALPLAQRLALAAAQCFGAVGATLDECLARALAIAAGGDADDAQIAMLLVAGERGPLPLVGAQILALVAPATTGEQVLERVRDVPLDRRGERREVLSVAEMIARGA